MGDLELVSADLSLETGFDGVIDDGTGNGQGGDAGKTDDDDEFAE